MYAKLMLRTNDHLHCRGHKVDISLFILSCLKHARQDAYIQTKCYFQVITSALFIIQNLIDLSLAQIVI